MGHPIRAAALAALTLAAVSVPARADGVLVFGGTGRLGAEIVKQLVNAGEKDVTVFARPTSDRSRLEGLDVSYVTGDALDGADVEAAFKSASFRAAFNALAVSPLKPNEAFYETTQAHITEWAARTGVGRVILNSSVGVGDSSHVYPESMRPMFGAVLDDKGKAEENLTSSGVEYAIIRNYQILPETTPVTGDAYLTEDRSATGGIGRADLGVLNVFCLDGYLCRNKTFHAIARER